MPKFRLLNPKQQAAYDLVLCEGETEVNYFSRILDRRKCAVRKAKASNAKKLVMNDALGSHERKDWKIIYCVFDRDQQSNTIGQLHEANRGIKDSGGKLKRVFSNPCFEIIFWFNFNSSGKEFIDCSEVIRELHKYESSLKYDKSEKALEQIYEHTDFTTIYTNAENVYNRLAVDDNNWLNIGDGYSEIFKLSSLALCA